MMDQAIVGTWLASMDCLLQGIQNEARRGTGAALPAYDPPGDGVDHEGDVDEAGPGMDIGEVDDPQRIRPGDLELAVDPVQRAQCLRIADGGHAGFTAPYPCQA